MKAGGKKEHGQTGKPPAMRVLSILLAFALSQFYLVLPASAQTTTYSVTGTVYYHTTPLDKVRVDLLQGNASGPVLQTTTTKMGFYSFSGVAPGSYGIEAWGPSPEYSLAIGSGVSVSRNSVKDIYIPKLMNQTSPAHEAEVTDFHPTLSWTPIEEARQYGIQINVVEGWELVEMARSYSTNYTVKKELTPGVVYNWYTDAWDEYDHWVGTGHGKYFKVVWPQHDLAITMIMPSTINTGTATSINATITNRGLNTESNITTQLLVNGDVFATQAITHLQNASSIEQNLPLNASSIPGTYNLTITVIPVPNETSLENNRITHIIQVISPPKISHTILYTIQPTEATAGQSIVITGTIYPAISTQPIILMYTQPNGQTFNKTITCQQNGSFSTSSNPNITGIWTITVFMLGNATHLGTATTRTFSVIEAGMPTELDEFTTFISTLMIIAAITLLVVAALIFMFARLR